MPGKKIDNLRKAKYKQSRLRGESIAKSMINAGSKETTAYHDAKNSALVKTCERELLEEVKKSDITVDWVVKRLTSELSSTDCKASDRIRIAELLGKYLKMFSDNNIQQTVVNINDVISDLRSPIDTQASAI